MRRQQPASLWVLRTGDQAGLTGKARARDTSQGAEVKVLHHRLPDL